MKAILGHIGAWSPKAEQVATANYLTRSKDVNRFLNHFKQRIQERLIKFHQGFNELENEGYPVKAIAPQAAIYLTVNINLLGKTTPEGEVISSTPQITQYLLNEAKIAIVPFSAFGASADSTWYRLSVGGVAIEDITVIINQLKQAIDQLA